VKLEDYIQDLANSDVSVRIYAARALHWLEDDRALPPLVGALRDTNEGVRYQAANSLEKLTGQNLGIDAEAWEQWLAKRTSK
jgi:HEAT repeat protein